MWWRKPAIWSLADQGVAAIALFAFTMIVTRALPQAEFGELSVYLAWISLAGALLQPALVDASIVLTSRSQESRPSPHFAASRLSYAVMLGALLLATVLLWLLARGGLWPLLAMLLLSEVAVSAVAFLRRSGYADQRTGQGLGVSTLSLLLTLTVLPVVMQRSGAQADDAIFARAAINVLVVSVTLGWQALGHNSQAFGGRLSDVHTLLQYSRSYVGGSVIFWITNSLQLALVGHLLSLEDAAGYRVALLLVLPLQQVQAAVYQIALPNTCRWAVEPGFRLQNAVVKLAIQFLGPAIVYAAILLLAGDWLLGMLFGADYGRFAWVVASLGALAILDAGKQIAVVLLYAQNRQALFLRYRLAALVLFVVAVLPALLAGSLGPFLAMSGLVNVLLTLYLIREFRKNTSP